MSLGKSARAAQPTPPPLRGLLVDPADSIGRINECHDRAICRTGCVPPVVRSRNILIAGHVAPALVRVVADVFFFCSDRSYYTLVTLH